MSSVHDHCKGRVYARGGTRVRRTAVVLSDLHEGELVFHEDNYLNREEVCWDHHDMDVNNS